MPEAHGDTCEGRRSHRRHLEHGGTLNRNAQDVRLELHQEVVLRRPAIDAQRLQGEARVGLKALDHVAGLVRDRLEGGADHVLTGRPTGEPHEGSPGAIIPIRGAEAHEGGHQVHAAGVVYRARGRSGLRRIRQKSQAVAEPLHGGAGDEDASLEGVGEATVDPPTDRRDQAVLRHPRLGTRVHQQETAGPVGVLRLARGDAALTEERRLLVAGDTRDGNLGPEPFRIREAEDAAAVANLRQHRPGNLQGVQQEIVPVALVDVVDERS